MMHKVPGTIVGLRYRVAVIPILTHDVGWVWLQSYQVLVVRYSDGTVRRKLGHWHNWFTRSWSVKGACRGDGHVWMDAA
jgi:hypothetical protein